MDKEYKRAETESSIGNEREQDTEHHVAGHENSARETQLLFLQFGYT